MGWWQLDRAPDEGPAEARGAGAGDGPYYLGDAPWDVVEDAMRQVDQVLADQPRPDKSEARQLVQGDSVPARLAALGPQAAERLCRIVGDMWAELAECYEEAWGRPLLPAEKEALACKAVSVLLTPCEIPAEYLADLDASPPEKVRSYLQMLREQVAAGDWLRIEDRGGPVDITSAAAFDAWAARRYPGVNPAP